MVVATQRLDLFPISNKAGTLQVVPSENAQLLRAGVPAGALDAVPII